LGNQLQIKKFHELFHGLHVALKATLPLDAEIKCSPEMTFGELIEINKDRNVKRACMPAVVAGDLKDGGRIYDFKQWFDPTPVEFYQLCFQLKPVSKKPLKFREVVFGRASEDKPFGFRAVSPYINLQFMSRTEEFEPLFCRVVADSGKVEYYQIFAGIGEDGNAYVLAVGADSNAVPAHLRN